MGAYESQLRHVVEPAYGERDDARSVTIADYEALWYSEVLREFAHYSDYDNAEIALAYAEYIDTKVRDEGVSRVSLYTHTEAAADTLVDALTHHVQRVNDTQLPTDVAASLEETFAAHWLSIIHNDNDSE